MTNSANCLLQGRIVGRMIIKKRSISFKTIAYTLDQIFVGTKLIYLKRLYMLLKEAIYKFIQAKGIGCIYKCGNQQIGD